MSDDEHDEEIQQVIKDALDGMASQIKSLNVKELHSEIKLAGMESSNLIIGIDFTNSNLDQDSSHIDGEGNLYAMVLEYIQNGLCNYHDNETLQMYSFGDSKTRHHSVALLGDEPCEDFDNIVKHYTNVLDEIRLSGPTSFAPLIDKAIETVRESGGQYHILIIISDGDIPDTLKCLDKTKEAIIRASDEPLSIVMIGIGDGPWDLMKSFQNELPGRKFENFHFVRFNPFVAYSSETGELESLYDAFEVAAIQMVPSQYTAIKKYNLLEREVSTSGNDKDESDRKSGLQDAPNSTAIKNPLLLKCEEVTVSSLELKDEDESDWQIVPN